MSDDDCDQMIEDCENRESRLSPWEATFIDSIQKQKGDGKRLTDKQIETLNEIWERVTAKG